MNKLRQRVRQHPLTVRAISGTTILTAIIAIASLGKDISLVSTVEHWVRDNPAITVGVLAILILFDDLAMRFGRHGSAEERVRQRSVEEQRVKYLAFISASSGEESFYSLIFNHLVQCAGALSDADTRLLVIPWFPKNSFDIGKELRDDVRALRRVNNFQFSGVFIIPDDPDTDVEDLRLLRDVSDNIVFMDVTFDPANPPPDWSPCFVGGDERRGAQLAASIGIEYVTKANIADPHFLVLIGRSTRWESQRYITFQEAIAQELPTATVAFSDRELQYSRQNARQYVYRQLKMSSSVRAPDVIFACNDDMAIGAHDAIRRLMREGVEWSNEPPRIIGYDGIAEIRDLIDAEDELILGTVDVSIKHLAHHAMENMKYMIEGRAVVYRSPQMQVIRGSVAPPTPTGLGQ